MRRIALFQSDAPHSYGEMRQGEQIRLELTIPSPLRELCNACMTCVPTCCNLDAFDLNASAIFRWLAATPAESRARALEQLDILITQVTGYNGPAESPIKLKFEFEYALEPQANCIGHLQSWRDEIVRAIAFGLEERKDRDGTNDDSH